MNCLREGFIEITFQRMLAGLSAKLAFRHSFAHKNQFVLRNSKLLSPFFAKDD